MSWVFTALLTLKEKSMILELRTLIYCILLISTPFLQSVAIADDKTDVIVTKQVEEQPLTNFQQRYQRELEEENKYKKELELEQQYQQYSQGRKIQEGLLTLDSTPLSRSNPPPQAAPRLASSENEPSDEEKKTGSKATEKTWWSTQNAMTISLVVLIFGLLFVVLLARMVKKESSTTEELMKLFLIPLIIIMGVFLVVAGYSDTQITPVMTLLGTIIGFLFGTKPKPNPEDSSSTPDKQVENNGDK